MEFLIQAILVLVVIGVVLWLINFLPIDATIKQIITGLIIILVVIWLLLSLLGVAGGGGLSFPRLR